MGQCSLGVRVGLVISSFMVPESTRDWVSEQTLLEKRRNRGRLSDSALVRDILDAWVEEGCPVVERERTDGELLKVTWSLEKQQVKSLEDASIGWSSTKTRLTKSDVLRWVLARAQSRK